MGDTANVAQATGAVKAADAATLLARAQYAWQLSSQQKPGTKAARNFAAMGRTFERQAQAASKKAGA